MGSAGSAVGKAGLGEQEDPEKEEVMVREEWEREEREEGRGRVVATVVELAREALAAVAMSEDHKRRRSQTSAARPWCPRPG